MMSCSATKAGEKQEEGEMFGVTVFGFPSNHYTFFKEEVLKAQVQAVPMCHKTNLQGR